MSFRVELEFLDGLFDIPPKQSRLSELAKSIVLFLRAVHLTTILQSIPFRNGLVDTASLLPKDGVFTLCSESSIQPPHAHILSSEQDTPGPLQPIQP